LTTNQQSRPTEELSTDVLVSFTNCWNELSTAYLNAFDSVSKKTQRILEYTDFQQLY